MIFRFTKGIKDVFQKISSSRLVGVLGSLGMMIFSKNFLSHFSKSLMALVFGIVFLGSGNEEDDQSYSSVGRKQGKKMSFIGLLLFVFLFGAQAVLGQTNTWDGSSNANWNTAANWSLNLVPTSTHDVVIPNGITANISVNTAAVCNSFVMNGGNTANTVTITGTNSLTVSGAVSLGAGTGNGDHKRIAVGAGTLTCGQITMVNTGGNNRDNGITITSGTVSVMGNITMPASATRNYISISGSGTLNIGGPISTITGGLTAATGSIVNYNGSAHTIKPATYSNLTSSGSDNKTLAANTTANGTVTVRAGTTLALSTFTLGAPSNLVLEGGATVGSAITGSGTLSLGGNITVNDATTGSSGATIFAPVALGANRTITVGDDGSGATDLTISGAINNGGGTRGITKAGDGTMVLSRVNTYTGVTTISEGILRLGATNVISNSSNIVLSGGTFSTGAASGFTETIGTLGLTANSTIELGTDSHDLNFAASNGVGWTGGRTLTITGWTTTDGSTGTSGKIFVGSNNSGLTTAQLAQITFSGFEPGAIILNTGEVVPIRYKAQFILADFGNSTWCAGETRNVKVTIKNIGSATWTDGAGGTPVINIGVKWNTNGTSWNDYRIRTSAENLAPGASTTYTLPLTASNFTLANGYTTTLAAGNNNITFDVVSEGVSWFGDNNNGVGPGNTIFKSSNITIAPVAEIDDISTIACSNTGFTLTPLDGTNGTIPSGTTFSWPAPAVTGGVTGGTASSGTPSSITGTLVNPTNIARSAIYTVTPITNGCEGATFKVTVLLNPAAAITPIPIPTCSESLFTVTPVNGTNGQIPANTDYTWTAPTMTTGLTGGIAGSGASISGTLKNSTNTAQTATYTVTPITGSCVGNDFTVTVTVNPKPTISTIPAASCSNAAFTVTPVNGTNGIVPAATSYSWTSPSLPAGVTGGAVGTGSSITGTLTNSTNAPLIATYTVIPTSGTCLGNAFTVTVTVNPSPVIPTQTPNICSGSAFTVSPVNGGATIVPAGTTYIWTVLDNTNVTGESAQPTAQSTISQTLINTSAIPQTVTYTVTPTSGAAGNCVGNSFTLNATVYPTPILNSPPPAPRCSNVSTAYTATSATPGTTFSWTRAVVTGISNAAGSGAIATATETLINTTTNAIDVIYIYSLKANGCTNTQNVNVTVNPTPALSSTLTPTAICSNGVFSYNPTSATSGATFTWTRAAISGISNGAITTPQTNNPNEVLVNTTTDPIPVIYTYSITANGCTNTQNLTVVVNPTPALNSTLAPAAVCSNSPFTYTPTSLTSAANFTWTRAAVTGISNVAVTVAQASAPNETLINTTANPINVIYAFFITANGCTNTQNVTVRVNPTPVLSTTLTPAAICSDSPFTYTPNSATIGTAFTWTRAAVTGISNAAVTTAQTSNPNEVLVNTTVNPLPVLYAYTITANGCSNTQNIAVIVNPTPTLTTTLTPAAICSNSAFTYSPSTDTPSSSITWTRAAVTGIINTAISTPQATNPNEMLVNTTALAIDVVYVYTISANGCSNTQNVTVTVNPTPSLSSTLTPAAVCSNTPFNYTPISLTPLATFTWTRAAVTGISNAAVTIAQSSDPNETLVNTTANPIDVVYAFSIMSNGCTNTQNVTVTVNPTPILSSDTTLGICDEISFNYTATSATTGTTFSWSRAVVGGISNAVGTGSGATITEILDNTTAAPIDVIYTYTLTANGCSITEDITVTVSPTPTLNTTLTPTAICSNEVFSYTPGSDTAGAMFTWTRAALTGISNAAITNPQSSDPSETLVNTSTAPINVIYAYTISANGCSNTQNVSVTVNPTPKISAITSSVCTTGTFTITPVHGTDGVVPTGTKYTWTVANNSNVTGQSAQGIAQNSISQTLTNTSGLPQDVIYTVTPITGTCAGNPFIVTVTVNGDTVIDTDPSKARDEVCFGDTFTSISVIASGAAGLTYQWFSNSTDSNVGGTAVVGATSATFIPPSSAEGESYYYVVVSGACSTITSETSGRYLVTPTVIVVVTPLDIIPQTICPGDTFSPLTFEALGANLTYQWYSNTSASTTGGTPITGEINSDFTAAFLPGTYGPLYFYALAASDCGTVTSSVSGAFEITHAVSAAPNQTLCVDTPINPVITHTTTGTTGIANNGVAGANGLPPGVRASWNAGVITISGTPTSSAGSPYNYSIPLIGACGTEVATGTITVNPKAVINNLSETICTSGSFSITPADGTDGVILAGTTYAWSVPAMNGGITGGVAGNGSSITGALTNPTNSPQTAVYTVTPSSGTCTGPTFTLTVTVNPSPSIPAQTTTICDADTFTVSPSNGGSTRVPVGTSYTWTVIDNANVTGESAQTSAQLNISQTLANSSNIPQNVVYTVTPLSDTCPGAPFTVTITVNPDPEITTLTDMVCSGSPFIVSPSNGGGNVVPAGTTYTWTVANTTNVSGQSDQASSQTTISQNLTNLTDTPQEVVYTVTPTSGAAGNCVGDTFTVTVTVNPSPVIEDQTDVICSEDTFTISPANGGSTIVPTGTVYTWTVANNSNVTGESTQTTGQNTISQTLTNTSNAPQNVIYTVTPQSGSNGNCAGNPFTVTVTVNPTASLSSSLTPMEICSNSGFTYTPTSEVAGATFTWTRAAVTGISNAAIPTAQTSNPNELLINTTPNPLDVVYTFTTSANGCSTTQDVTVSVKPIPVLSSTLTPAEICGNSTFTYTPTSATTGATFTWTRASVTGISNPAITTPQSSNPNEVLINTTGAAINVVYAFTTLANGCSSTQNVTVSVNPRPTLSSTLNPASICSNTAFTYTPISASGSATFTWTRAAVVGISNAAITAPQSVNPNEVLLNTTANPIEVVYVYTINSNGCTNTENVRVTVNPTPVLSSSLTPTAICSGSVFTYAATTTISGTSISWTRPAVSGIINPAVSTPQTVNPSETLVNTTDLPINVIYVYSLTANGCTNTQNVVIRVNPTPTLSSGLTPSAVCSNSAFIYTPTSDTPGAAFSWVRAVVSGISNVAGSGSGPINETLVNTTSSPINVVYALTTIANGCSTTENVTVRIEPVPYITNQFPGNPFDIRYDICSGQSFSFTPQDVVDGIIPAGTTYSWVFTNENGNLSGSSNGSGTSISGTITNSDTRRRNVDYVVTPRYNGCDGTPFTVRVRVEAEPTVDPITSPSAVCNGITVGPFSFTGRQLRSPNGQNDIPTEYNWTNDNPSIGLSTSGTGDIPSFTGINNGVAPVTATITVTPEANGCNGPSETFTITVNPTPKVTIVPDYCVVGGKVQLIANSNIAGTTWLWNTGQTTQSILVDLSGNYKITATGPNGCNTTENISVAEELVINGDFTDGNIVDPSGITGFNTGYMYLPDLPTVTNELEPDNGTRGYSIATNGKNVHGNFWGLDHTGNTAGTRNMMIVNGKGPQLTIWEQTVIIEPNTDYYFSAWAMSLNNAGPFARLQFEVNGTPVGTEAILASGVENNSNSGWQRFYSNPVWKSYNLSGPIKIRIINNEPSNPGNDFAIDDISFGTLSTFINLTSGAGTDSQTVCQDSPINGINYTVGSGVLGPDVTWLPSAPAGITPVWNGVTLNFSGTPTESGIFNYTISTATNGNCAPATATGTITVKSTPAVGTITANQTVCAGGDPDEITGTVITPVPGTTISYRWESNTNLTTPNWETVTSNPSGANYNPPVLTKTTQYRRITLSALYSLICESVATDLVQVTVQNTPTSGSIATDQVICNAGDPAPFTSVVAGGGDGIISYRWESSVEGSSIWSPISGPDTDNYDAPTGLSETTLFRRITISSVGGKNCESTPTDPVKVTVNAIPTAGSIGTDQPICSGEVPAAFTNTDSGTGSGSLYYIWESAVSPFGVTDWNVINGANLETYGELAGLTVDTKYRRTTVSTFNGITCESLPTTPVTVTVTPNNWVSPPIDPALALCVNKEISTIIHTTTGENPIVIVPEGTGIDYNLPNGVKVIWTSTGGDTGELSISGTPTEMGVFNYSIPLDGCGSVSATGTITVMNPSYPITNIKVVNPTAVPGVSIFTVYSPGLTVGTYDIEYSTSGINGGATNVSAQVIVTTPGQFPFNTLPQYSNEGTSILTINSIKKSTDPCAYEPPNNNTAPYGVGCSSEFNGTDSFYVPANVYEVRIEAYGDGSPIDSVTIAVIPGGVINIGISGNEIFATDKPLASATPADWIVSATGPNSRIVFQFDCNPLVPSCTGLAPNESIDSEGFTVLRFDVGACEWKAPDGLVEFEVLIVGGGGGGGYGNAAGGGGGGAVVYQHYNDIKTGELIGLQGAVFPLSVGTNGAGAIAVASKGESGNISTFSGPSFTSDQGSFADFTVLGGGGGGSTSTSASVREGLAGASGGGGAAFGTEESAGGDASAGNNGGTGYGETSGTGGGGGGGASGKGLNAENPGIMNGGKGGSGVTNSISGGEIYYGAGGGGTSSGAITNEAGAGGSPYPTGAPNYFAGGSGTNNGAGQSATTFGSGGGAGRDGGGAGFPGVIYIRYPNYRILPVEYLYFNAKYNSMARSGDLTWATAKEWENDRFEIERSVNNVKEWEAIGEVAGAGYSDGEVKYDYSDRKLPVAGGNIFYRLKQFDFDGDFTYSDTKSIKVETLSGITHWKVFPNPTTGKPFNIEILDTSMYQDEPITLRIISATGQYETIQVSEMKKMGDQVSDWFTTKAAGIYTLEISWGIQKEYHKVILRR